MNTSDIIEYNSWAVGFMRVKSFLPLRARDFSCYVIC